MKSLPEQERAKLIAQRLRAGDPESALALLPAEDDPVLWTASLLMLKALALRELGALQEAIAAARRATELPSVPAAAFALSGDLEESAGNLAQAERAYHSALAIEPAMYPAMNGLAVVYQRQGDTESAIHWLKQAVHHHPQRHEAHHNLASLLMALKPDDALRHWRVVLALKPEHERARLDCVRALLALGRFGEAISTADESAIPKHAQAELLVLKGTALDLIGETERASRCFDDAAKRPDASPEVILASAEYQAKTGRAAEAREIAQRDELQNSVKARLIDALALPGICSSRTELNAVRENFESQLRKLSGELKYLPSLTPAQASRELLWTNFQLAYLGGDDRALQQQFARLTDDMMAKACPSLYRLSVPEQRRPGQRLRLGFVSSFFFDHTVGWYFHSWITRLPRDCFEVCVWHLGVSHDWLTLQLRERADTFNAASHMAAHELGSAIQSAQADILIYPEIGMCPKTQLLAGMRLAPVQVSAWGHPVTSGHANIDWRLSVAAMEPAEAQGHYCEPLRLLPGLGTCYPQPNLPQKADRHALGPASRCLAIVPQSLFKIHPDNDALWMGLLRRVPQLDILFFEDASPYNTRAFKQRLHEAAKQSGVEDSRLRWLPRTNRSGFLSVLQACDLMLDTMHWSGGNTSLDALSCGLPLVTLPGRFMRGRQSMGMLALMGLADELVATSEESFISIVEIIADRADYRRELSDKILVARNQLFGRMEPVEDLISFLLAQGKA